MVLEVPDELHREMVVRSPRDRVWAAVTEPDQLVRWFPTLSAEVDLRPGGTMRFAWEQGGDEAVIDEIEAPTRFVFRWRPAGLDRPFTTVRITLEEVEGGTRITLTESGFASLPDEIHRQSYEGNLHGWAEELEELRALLEDAA